MEYESCFIISSSNQNTAFLREYLKNKGVNLKKVLLDFNINMMKSIRKTIKESDFICCIINQDTTENQMVELGIAIGLHKPIFLIVEDEKKIPFSIKNFVYVKASLDNINAISFNLDQFLKSNEYKNYFHQDKRIKDKSKIDINNIEYLISKIYESNISNDEICNILENILSYYKDKTIFTQKRNKDKGADLALWIDEVEMSVGGPILIDLKTSINLDNQNNLIKSYISQMKNFLEATKSPVGIILYKGNKDMDDNFKVINKQLPLIIVMEIKTFVDYLINEKLARFLINKRNEVVHRDGSNE